MVKRNQSKLVQGILFAAGMIFICASVYFLIHDIHTYIQQFDQRDWRVKTATVINVHTSIKSTHGTNTTSHYTVYDIYYQYEVNGNIYTGVIDGVNAGKEDGETFDIKYDPEAPQDSPQYLKPTFGFVVSGVLGFIFFGTIGLRMVGSSLPHKKKASSRNRKNSLYNHK